VFDMTAGPRGTAGCELRQVREEAAAAIPTLATVSPGCQFDGFVKSPTSAFRCILRHCGVP